MHLKLQVSSQVALDVSASTRAELREQLPLLRLLLLPGGSLSNMELALALAFLLRH